MSNQAYQDDSEAHETKVDVSNEATDTNDFYLEPNFAGGNFFSSSTETSNLTKPTMFKEIIQDINHHGGVTTQTLKDISKTLNRKCAYRYLLYKKSSEYYKWKELWLATVPLVGLSLLNVALAISNFCLKEEVILLNTFIIVFSTIHSVWKMTTKWVNWEKVAERFSNYALQMDVLSVEFSILVSKSKLNDGVLNLETEKRDLILFLEKAHRIDVKLSEGLSEVPKNIRKEVDQEIEKLQEMVKMSDGNPVGMLMIENGELKVKLEEETAEIHKEIVLSSAK